MKKLIIVLMLTASLMSCGANFSNGERAGIVTKLSEKGLVWKSWEGEMLVSLPIDVAGTTQPEKFRFNVSPEALDQVKAAMASSKRVTLVYKQWFMAPPFVNDHVIIGVK